MCTRINLENKDLLCKDPVSLLLQKKFLLVLEEDLGTSQLVVLQLLFLVQNFPHDLFTGCPTVNLPKKHW